MYKQFFIYVIKEILYKFKIDIVRKKTINFDKNFSYSNLNLLESNIIINYKLSNLITTNGKRLGSTKDPYLYVLKDSFHLIEKKEFTKTFVDKIKLTIKYPQTAAQVIGIVRSKKLSLYPEWALVLPWEDISINQNYKTYLIRFIEKRKKLKELYKNLKKKDGDKLIYHDFAWESHAEQYINLYKSISNYGFKKTSSIPVHLFKYKNLYRLSLSEDGNHRVRIAYMLNLKTIPLKISKIIDLENIEDWTNVKNGLYSLNEARKIFKNYFNYVGEGKYF